MTDPMKQNHDRVMSAVYGLLRNSLDDEPRVRPSNYPVHGAEDDLSESYRREQAEQEARDMCRSAEQLYDNALIDAGPAGQSFARILAAVFRGEAVPAELIEKARDEFADGMVDYLMRGR